MVHRCAMGFIVAYVVAIWIGHRDHDKLYFPQQLCVRRQPPIIDKIILCACVSLCEFVRCVCMGVCVCTCVCVYIIGSAHVVLTSLLSESGLAKCLAMYIHTGPLIHSPAVLNKLTCSIKQTHLQY